MAGRQERTRLLQEGPYRERQRNPPPRLPGHGVSSFSASRLPRAQEDEGHSFFGKENSQAGLSLRPAGQVSVEGRERWPLLLRIENPRDFGRHSQRRQRHEVGIRPPARPV